MNLRHYNSNEAPDTYQLMHDLVVTNIHKGAYMLQYEMKHQICLTKKQK